MAKNAPSAPPRAAAAGAPRATASMPADLAASAFATSDQVEQDKALPLPGWLVKVYFIFPIVLYIPDAIFNYFVYSDGATVPQGNLLLQISQVTLWAFMSIGVVGMAYLLSVLAPYHWSLGHRIQAFFCGVGVVVATAITTWNSLAFRSTHFQPFATDRWVDSIWPQMQGISLTMILVAIAPPFWGLFWAIVQPTQTGRSLRQLQESHAERLLRLEQESELKRARAEANAKVRSAQLRGLAQTAATARDQAREILGRNTGAPEVVESTLVDADSASDGDGDENADTGSDSGELPVPPRVLQLPTGKAPGGRNEAVFFNHAAAVTPTVRTAPTGSARPAAAQPALLSEADAQAAPAASLGDPAPWGARRPPVPGGGIMGTFFSDDDQMTGTTGPRPAVRRPGENNVLFRGISEDISAQALTAVQDVFDELNRELNPDGTRKSMPKKEFVSRLMSRLNVDEATAQKAIDYWTKARKTRRSGQR